MWDARDRRQGWKTAVCFWETRTTTAVTARTLPSFAPPLAEPDHRTRSLSIYHFIWPVLGEWHLRVPVLQLLRRRALLNFGRCRVESAFQIRVPRGGGGLNALPYARTGTTVSYDRVSRSLGRGSRARSEKYIKVVLLRGVPCDPKPNKISMKIRPYQQDNINDNKTCDHQIYVSPRTQALE